MRNRRVIKSLYKPSNKQTLIEAVYEYKESQNYDEDGNYIGEDDCDDYSDFEDYDDENMFADMYEYDDMEDRRDIDSLYDLSDPEDMAQVSKDYIEIVKCMKDSCATEEYELKICNNYLICKIAGYNLAINTSSIENYLFNNEDDITINNKTYHFKNMCIDEDSKTKLEALVGNKIDGEIGLDLIACETMAIVKTDKTHGTVCFGMGADYYKYTKQAKNTIRLSSYYIPATINGVEVKVLLDNASRYGYGKDIIFSECMQHEENKVDIVGLHNSSGIEYIKQYMDVYKDNKVIINGVEYTTDIGYNEETNEYLGESEVHLSILDLFEEYCILDFGNRMIQFN